MFNRQCSLWLLTLMLWACGPALADEAQPESRDSSERVVFFDGFDGSSLDSGWVQARRKPESVEPVIEHPAAGESWFGQVDGRLRADNARPYTGNTGYMIFHPQARLGDDENVGNLVQVDLPLTSYVMQGLVLHVQEKDPRQHYLLRITPGSRRVQLMRVVSSVTHVRLFDVTMGQEHAPAFQRDRTIRAKVQTDNNGRFDVQLLALPETPNSSPELIFRQNIVDEEKPHARLKGGLAGVYAIYANGRENASFDQFQIIRTSR